MKTIIAALALLSLAAGPVFAVTPAWQLNHGEGFYAAPGVHVSPNLWTTSREGLVEAH
jgi:hypothetical protein